MNYDVISGLACMFCMVYILGLMVNFYGMYSTSTRKLFSILLVICLIYFLGEYVQVKDILEAGSLRPYYGVMCFSGLILLITHIHSISVKLRRKTMIETIDKAKYLSSLPLQTLGNTDILSDRDSIVQGALQNGVSKTVKRYILFTEITAWAGFAVSALFILRSLIVQL
jgi:hypothetical protein